MKNSNSINAFGSIYILSNPSLQGIVKIGWTIKGADERAKELSKSTAIPTPFEVEEEQPVEWPTEVEAGLHRELRKFRVSPNKEFFRLSPDDASDAIWKYLYGGTISSEKALIRCLASWERLMIKYPKRWKFQPNILEALSEIVKASKHDGF